MRLGPSGDDCFQVLRLHEPYFDRSIPFSTQGRPNRRKIQLNKVAQQKSAAGDAMCGREPNSLVTELKYVGSAVGIFF